MRSVFGYFNNVELNVDSTFDSNCHNFYGFLNSNNKFELDKVFYETPDFIIALDGVILNKLDLVKDSCDWPQYVLSEWLNDSVGFLNALRGEFVGFVYNKKTDSLELFNNPTGTKNIYFYYNKQQFAFASSAIDLIELVKELKWKIQLSSDACYSFLAYGALLNGTNWLQKSEKLLPGNILTLNNNQISKTHYKSFKIDPLTSYSKSELMKEFDELMKKAVCLEWEKDREYGYRSFATLSGGLDSRVNVMLARKLGFTEQDNFCCSKKGYADETISRKMASDFQHKYYFHPLDGQEHFRESEYMMNKLGGSSVYMGPAHLRFGIDKFWNNNYGIIHSGQLGDAFLGGFLSGSDMKNIDLSFGRESFETFPKNESFDIELIKKYPNEEAFKINERAFQIANSGFWILEDLSYYTSPFYDIDVLDFLVKLPYDLKYKRQFYMEWIIKYHPEMTEYKWEYIHSKPNALWKIKYATQFMRLKYGVRKLLSPKFRASFDMTPEQYWFENSDETQAYYKEKMTYYRDRLSDFSYPYKTEIEKFSTSSNFGQLSKALSILIIFNQVLIPND